MDIFWLVVGALFILAGIIGSLLPLLPGPPLCYIGLLLQQLQTEPLFTTRFLLIWAGITVIVLVLDYVVPIYGTRKFGGSKYGMWGCTAGLVVGIFFPPWGMIIGPFIGAFIGEIIANQQSNHALRAAFGSFLGFLFSTLLKLICSVVMAWYFVDAHLG